MSAYRWPSEHDARLREICAGPETPSGFKISVMLNEEFGLALTYRSVIRRMVLLGLARSRTDGSDAWTGQRGPRLKTLYDRADAPSYQVIAEELNAEFGTAFTRCAISARISREGFANRNLLGLERAVKPRKIVAAVKRPRRAPTAAPAPVLVVVPLCPVRPGIKITDLEPGECRWPVSGGADGESYGFCGHCQHGSSSYCFSHFSLSRGDGTHSERAATRVSNAA